MPVRENLLAWRAIANRKSHNQSKYRADKTTTKIQAPRKRQYANQQY